MTTITGTSGSDTIVAHGPYLEITLSGSPADGVWPNLNIWVNGAPVDQNITVTADHSAGATQMIEVALTAPVTSFAIQYTNDLFDYSNGQDRNVYLSSILLNGVNIDPSTNATYDRTINGQYYDTIAGQYAMQWGGAMNFTGATVQSAGAQTGINTGSDTIDGGAGIDTVAYAGSRAGYTITPNADGSYTVAGNGVSDTLVNVERLQFADAKVAIDVHGDGGEAYRLYQAAFNRAPDAAGLGYWINDLDHGVALNDVAQAFVSSAEFNNTYGALNTSQFVNQLYENVLHRAGDSAGVAYWTGELDANALTHAQVLAFFSESPENQAALIGTIQNGMTYV